VTQIEPLNIVGINNGFLDQLFEHEKQLVQSGEWSSNSSALRTPGFFKAQVNELERQKHERFEKLAKMQETREKDQKEKVEKEILEALTESFGTEKVSIETGEWDTDGSYCRKISLDVAVSQRVSATARRIFDQLKAYESQRISDTERAKVDQEYQKEEALAQAEQWKHEDSYFFIIQKDPRFQKFDSALRQDIQSKLSVLGIMNWGNSRANESRETGADDDEAFLGKVRSILGISADDSFVDAKKAYRDFMMSYHPDRNPEGVSEEMADKTRELTRDWPALEEYLIKKENKSKSKA